MRGEGSAHAGSRIVGGSAAWLGRARRGVAELIPRRAWLALVISVALVARLDATRRQRILEGAAVVPTDVPA